MIEIDYTGQHIGEYLLLSQMARGAFSNVYLAQQQQPFERMVVVKLLHTYLRSTQEQEQFMQEAHVLAQLHHPHILPLLESGFYVDHLLPYLVMDYAPGGSLRALLTHTTPDLLPTEQAFALLTQTGQALHYAHQHHVVHRNLKPENILFNAQGEVLLADFEIPPLRSSRSISVIVPSRSFSSHMPKQMLQGASGEKSDQYALGCLAYELFTGHPPFLFDWLSMFAQFNMKRKDAPPPAPTQLNPSLLPSTEQTLLKAVAEQPDDRWPSILAFLTALSESTKTT